MRRLAMPALVIVVGVGAWLGLGWLEQQHTHQPYSQIEPGLYVGGRVSQPPPGTSAVLNLCEFEDCYRVDVARHIPLDGSVPPSAEQLQEMVAFIDQQRQAGATIYVHCLSGMNRSGMVITAYLMYEHGWSRDEALAFAQARRPQIEPNPAMMRLLAAWEQKLRLQ